MSRPEPRGVHASQALLVLEAGGRDSGVFLVGDWLILLFRITVCAMDN